jgi:stress-induced morphogen
VLNESHGKKEDESHFKTIIVSEAFADKVRCRYCTQSAKPIAIGMLCARAELYASWCVSLNLSAYELRACARAPQNPIARHRLVNAALKDPSSGGLPFHSLTIVAKTQAQWQADSSVAASPQCAGGDGSGLQR